jgi:DNA replication protein DnaC
MRSSPRILPHGSPKADGTTTAKSGGDLTETLKLPVARVLENASTPSTSASSERPAALPEDMFLVKWEPLANALGPRYSECTLENFELSADPKFAGPQRKVLNEIRNYLENLTENVEKGRGVVLYGPPGTGKDHLLVAMLREAAKSRYHVRWKDGMRLYRNVREAIAQNKGEGSIARPLIDANVLAISDPVPPKGESVTGFQATFMFDLIDSRYRARRPTWVTANFADSADADSRLGAQIVDRLRDGALALHCSWPSYRKSL